jgi:hypothetical protein
MPIIEINFSKHKPLVIQTHDDDTSNRFVNLLRTNIDRGDHVWRDPLKYTEEYFHVLCKEVGKQLQWDWVKDEYSLEQTTRMHKDIEKLLEKSESFKHIPGHLQNLIHEAHFCIHQIQYGKQDRTPFIQIEWFNDDHVPMPDDTTFHNDLEFGDIVLQNPYVGHPPVQCYQQNDYKNIDRTCQFHDVIKPGVKINTCEGTVKGYKDKDKYKSWWIEHCPDYVNKVGWETIEKYSGWSKVGKVIDKDNLYNIQYEKQIELIGIKTYDQV